MPAKKKLGVQSGKSQLEEIELKLISPDPNQPRKEMGDLTGLVDSIKEHGLIQPIIVTKVDDGYLILAGERRYTAARLARLKSVTCIVRDIEEHERLELQLIENIHRRGLDPIEEAKAFRTLLEEHELSQEKLAKQVGMSAPTINQTVRLLDLPEKIGYSDFFVAKGISDMSLIKQLV